MYEHVPVSTRVVFHCAWSSFLLRLEHSSTIKPNGCQFIQPLQGKIEAWSVLGRLALPRFAGVAALISRCDQSFVLYRLAPLAWRSHFCIHVNNLFDGS